MKLDVGGFLATSPPIGFERPPGRELRQRLRRAFGVVSVRGFSVALRTCTDFRTCTALRLLCSFRQEAGLVSFPRPCFDGFVAAVDRRCCKATDLCYQCRAFLSSFLLLMGLERGE